MPEGQKRVPDHVTGGCEPQCGCWELNSGPLEEQEMLSTTEPSLQPLGSNFYRSILYSRLLIESPLCIFSEVTCNP